MVGMEIQTAYTWEKMLPLFISKLIFRNSEEEYIYENFTILLSFLFSSIRHTFFQNMLQKSPLSLHVGYVFIWERKKKKKKGRMFVCEERERGVCSMGAYTRRHGIALTLTPNTAKSLGKAYGYILPHTSALKSDYISLVYLSLQM